MDTPISFQNVVSTPKAEGRAAPPQRKGIKGASLKRGREKGSTTNKGREKVNSSTTQKKQEKESSATPKEGGSRRRVVVVVVQTFFQVSRVSPWTNLWGCQTPQEAATQASAPPTALYL